MIFESYWSYVPLTISNNLSHGLRFLIIMVPDFGSWFLLLELGLARTAFALQISRPLRRRKGGHKAKVGWQKAKTGLGRLLGKLRRQASRQSFVGLTLDYSGEPQANRNPQPVSAPVLAINISNRFHPINSKTLEFLTARKMFSLN